MASDHETMREVFAITRAERERVRREEVVPLLAACKAAAKHLGRRVAIDAALDSEDGRDVAVLQQLTAAIDAAEKGE